VAIITDRHFTLPSEQAGSYGSVAFSPDGKLLATATSNWDDDRPGIVTVWDTASSNRVAELKGHTRGVFRVAFSPDGKTLASSGFDRMIHLWEVSGWQKKASALATPPEWATPAVLQLSFSPDGKTIAAGGNVGCSISFRC